MDKNKKIEPIQVDRLQFDPENPRFPSFVNSKDEAAILGWMLEDATIIELMGSIGQNDYFPGEPLLVVPDPDKKGDYRVIEGNRRLTAVKLLNNPEKAPVRKKSVQIASLEAEYKPKNLPVVVFDTSDEILDYLGYRHITGIKRWGPLEKAKYLKRLKERSLQITSPELAKIIGSRSDYVDLLLTGLTVYDEIENNNFFGLNRVNAKSIDFSILTTALSYTNIAKFLGLESGRDLIISGIDKSRLKELTSWLFQEHAEGKTRLGESRNLKVLNRIVDPENSLALTAFKEGGYSLADADLLTGAPTEVFRVAIMDAKARLQDARNRIHLIDKPTQTDADTLLEIQKLARTLKAAVDDKLLELENV